MHDTAQDWNETAVRQAMDECDNVPYLMIGSMAVGAVALAFTNYFVAGALTLGGVHCHKRSKTTRSPVLSLRLNIMAARLPPGAMS